MERRDGANLIARGGLDDLGLAIRILRDPSAFLR
jgi:hypothetical protein